jgi:Xaa-Pro aminopeptidase
MNAGDLVMVDFGAEYGYYCADITRTLPVNGEFSPEQSTIYEIVLEAHLAAINSAAPGVNYNDLRSLARDIVLDRLLEKGIITGVKSQIISSNTFYRYIPAGLTHPVGLDVHDPFPRNLEGNRILRENMVMTFEPHIYLYEGDPTVDPDYWNISARIEDVVLITSNGSEILSSDLPMQIDEIEEIMK